VLADARWAIKKQNILERTAVMGEYHMPKIGTTVIDTAGVALIKRYILSLNNFFYALLILICRIAALVGIQGS
jgi:hypothetical protein